MMKPRSCPKTLSEEEQAWFADLGSDIFQRLYRVLTTIGEALIDHGAVAGVRVDDDVGHRIELK